MKLNVCTASDFQAPGNPHCLVVPVFEGEWPVESKLLAGEHELLLQGLVDRGVFGGKAEESAFLPTGGAGYAGVLLLGLGKRAELTAERVRRAAGKAAGALKGNRVGLAVLDLTDAEEVPAEAFVEGVVLGQYDFDVYKKQPETPPVKTTAITVVAGEGADLNALQIRCELAALMCLSTNGARHLANTPPNEMTPSALAEFALGIARESGCECTVLDEVQMATLGMNALLGVARGSGQPPKLIVLKHHHADDAPTVAIVGKGVTFDSGGISIKPADGMHEMKYDMAGAAAVLCTMLNIVELKPAINVVCVVPTVENMTGDHAQRPGDIVKAYNGKTIEVLNTDAEGRLILADALAFTVEKYKPAAIVDVATLTGAVVVAIGHYASGLLGNDDALAAELLAAGEATGERLWRLPLWPEYEKLIESPHADLANIGPRGEAGAITAAAFIKQFIGETPWAHLDIAGTAWGAKNISYLDTKHASGYGVRLLTRWILDRALAG